MATEVKLPRLGQGMESGTIVRWLKAEGDQVTKGEPLYELDTDKVTQEVEAEADGVLLKIVLPEGEADVGTLVGVIGSAGEDVSELLAGAQGVNGGAPASAAAPQATGEPAPPETAEQPIASETSDQLAECCMRIGMYTSPVPGTWSVMTSHSYKGIFWNLCPSVATVSSRNFIPALPSCCW